jgi:nitroreductase
MSSSASPQDGTALQARKSAAPDHDILDVFARRWSPRAFADRRVEPEKIRRMLEAARWTMSSYNEQPWRYVVASRHDEPEAYAQLLRCLSDGNQSWAENAPVLMMSFYKTTFSRNDRPNRCAPHDTGAASAALTFQATAMDLYVHQMAGIEKDVARETYDVPDDFEPMAGLAVGYLGEPEMLNEKQQKSETSPRSRNSHEDFVFGETWGNPAPVVDGEA